MIRHIEMVKIGEIVNGKNRAEQLVDYTQLIDEMISNMNGVKSYNLRTRSDSLDPMDADLMLVIDFENEDALDEYGFDVDRLAITMQIAEHALSMLSFDYEV